MADVTCLLAATIECAGNFHKAKELNPHVLRGTWCRNVTDGGRRALSGRCASLHDTRAAILTAALGEQVFPRAALLTKRARGGNGGVKNGIEELTFALLALQEDKRMHCRGGR